MILAVSIQHDLERIKCPEKITKSQVLLPDMLLLVRSERFAFLHPTIITKSITPRPGILLLVKSVGFIFSHPKIITKTPTPSPVMLVLVMSLGYALYQLNAYKGGS